MWLGAIVLDTDNAENLSDFYKNLLGWEKSIQYSDGDQWISLMDKEHKYTPLVFQENSDYQRPVYPSEQAKQQQMLHMDFYVKQDELEKELAHAFACGATLVEVQHSDDWKVLLDPSGHPFCIIPIPKEMAILMGENS